MTAFLLLTAAAFAGIDPLPVVGGNVVSDPHAWPDAAGIIMSNQWMDVECTGTLVAPDIVVTAGHCNIGIQRVILDTNNYDHGGEIIGVKAAYEYKYGTGVTNRDPGDSEAQPNFDLTVLILDSKAEARPRQIASPEIIDQYLKDGASVTVVGYGAHDAAGYQYDDKLREGQTKVFDADCSDIWSGCERSISPNGELAAGGSDADSCYGDSGGPLYLDTPDGEFLVGITSRGPAPCGSWGSIYVRADAVVDYIEEVSGEKLGGLPPVPVAPPIYTMKNTAAITTIDPQDPDGNDGMTYSVDVQPLHGTASINDSGVVTYIPSKGFKGDDQLTVLVTDPMGLTGEASIVVKVLSHHTYNKMTGQGGCDVTGSDGAGLGGVLLALGLVLRRRSRR